MLIKAPETSLLHLLLPGTDEHLIGLEQSHGSLLVTLGVHHSAQCRLRCPRSRSSALPFLILTTRRESVRSISNEFGSLPHKASAFFGFGVQKSCGYWLNSIGGTIGNISLNDTAYLKVRAEQRNPHVSSAPSFS